MDKRIYKGNQSYGRGIERKGKRGEETEAWTEEGEGKGAKRQRYGQEKERNRGKLTEICEREVRGKGTDRNE